MNSYSLLQVSFRLHGGKRCQNSQELQKCYMYTHNFYGLGRLECHCPTVIELCFSLRQRGAFCLYQLSERVALESVLP